MFRTQVGDAVVLVWRQGEGEPASTGTAAPDRRFMAFGTDIFVWGRRRPGAATTSAAISSATGASTASTIAGASTAASAISAAAGVSIAGTLAGITGTGANIGTAVGASTAADIAGASTAAAAISAAAGASTAGTLAGSAVGDSSAISPAAGVASAQIIVGASFAAAAIGAATGAATCSALAGGGGLVVLSAPPLGHGPAATRRSTSAGRSRAAQLSTRTR